jgi:hypothetical protein
MFVGTVFFEVLILEGIRKPVGCETNAHDRTCYRTPRPAPNAVKRAGRSAANLDID